MAKHLKHIWDEVKEIQFEFMKVKDPFNTKSSFSSLDLNWEKCYHPTMKANVVVKCQSLFNFNPDDKLPEGTEAAIKYITSGCQLVPWPPIDSEEDLLLALHKIILAPLCRAGEVIFEKKQKFRDAGIRAEHMGMGSTETWYGSPDGRVRGCELVVVKPSCNDDDDDYEDEDDEDDYCSSSDAETSDGETTNIETKKKNLLGINI